MTAASNSEELIAARGEFESSLRRLRDDLRRDYGLSWRNVGFGALLLAAAVGFGLASRMRAGRAEAGRNEPRDDREPSFTRVGA